MGLGDALDVHLAPPGLWDVLPQAAAAGVQHAAGRSVAWILHRQTLLLWTVGDTDSAQIKRLVLTQPVSGSLHVEVVTRPASSVITVLACSSTGLLHVWLDASFLSSPHCEQLACLEGGVDAGGDVVTAVAAAAADQGTTPGFLAVVSTADGALHLYHGTSRGIFPRRFHSGGLNSLGRQHGLLGTLGTVVKAMYSEAFDPLASTRRMAASRLPACRMLLALTRTGSWRLYVLTRESLDCWQLGASSGNSTTEQLLWSFSLAGLLVPQLSADSLNPVDMTLCAAASALFIWTYQGGRHALHCLQLAEDGTPALDSTCSLTERLTDPQRHPDPFAWRLQTHSQQLCCLAHTPGGVLLVWRPRHRSQQQQVLELSASDGSLAVCSGVVAGQPVWQLLNKYHGVVDLEDLPPPPGSGEQACQALLDCLVGVIRKDARRGSRPYELAASLNKRLSRLGLWTGPGGRPGGFQLLRGYSQHLVDSPPVAGTGEASLALVRDQLSNKAAAHEVLLMALGAGGVMQQLSAAEQQELREHAEMTAAVLRVLDAWLQLEADARDAAGRGENGGAGSEVLVRHSMVKSMLCSAGEVVLGSGGTNGTSAMFSVFQYPTRGAPALYAAAQQHAEYRPEAAGDPGATDWDQLRLVLMSCGSLLLDAVNAASSERSALQQDARGKQQQQQQHGADGEVQRVRDWMATEEAFEAWWALSNSCIEVKQHLAGEEGLRLELAAGVHLPAVRCLLSSGEVLQGGSVLSGAVLEEVAGQQLDSLVEDADLELQGLRARGLLPESVGAALELSAAASTAMVWSVEPLAAQYTCWPQLAACCELLAAAHLVELQQQLDYHMRTGKGPAGLKSGFAFWFMDKMRQEGEVADLLAVGRRGFLAVLLLYLQDHPGLLWQAQVAARQFPQASSTLLVAAEVDNGPLPRRAFMASLAKLGAYAAADTSGYPAPDTAPDTCRAMAAAEALLLVSQLQEDLANLKEQQQQQDGEEQAADATEDAALSAAGVAQAALSLGEAMDPAAAALAVKALAVVPEQQQEELRDLWKSAWRRVLQQTDLVELLRLKEQPGSSMPGSSWQDGPYGEALTSCPLAQALLDCCRAAAAVSRVEGGRLQDISNMLEDVQEVLQQAAGAVNNAAAQAIIQDALQLQQTV